MYLILLLLGLIATVAGGAALAFGAQHNGFDIGNTLIIAGTTALMGGLILIALAQAVRQLRRIAEGLAMRADGRMAREPYEQAPAGVRPAPGRIPFPPKPEPRPRPAAAAAAAAIAAAAVPRPESRLEVAPRLDAPEEPLDQPSPAFAASEPEPRIAPEPEEAPPLSPQPGPRFTAPAGEKDELSEDLLATAFSRLDVALRRGAEPEEMPRQDAMAEEEAAAPEFREEPEPEPTLPPEVAALEPEPEPEPEAPQQPEEPYAVSILKSGVVDGMAYTLYSDGSIEAEMPQGTMRFVSIVELRAYLEQSSS